MVTCRACGGIIHAKLGNILTHDCRYPIRAMPKGTGSDTEKVAA